MSQTKFKVIENNSNNMDKEIRNKALEAAVSFNRKKLWQRINNETWF